MDHGFNNKIIKTDWQIKQSRKAVKAKKQATRHLSPSRRRRRSSSKKQSESKPYCTVHTAACRSERREPKQRRERREQNELNELKRESRVVCVSVRESCVRKSIVCVHERLTSTQRCVGEQGWPAAAAAAASRWRFVQFLRYNVKFVLNYGANGLSLWRVVCVYSASMNHVHPTTGNVRLRVQNTHTYIHM